MQIKAICINMDSAGVAGRVDRLEANLSYVQQCGFDGVELSIHGLDLVVGGRVHAKQLDRVRRIVDRFDLVRSVHAPDRLNLAFPQRIPGCKSRGFNAEFPACFHYRIPHFYRILRPEIQLKSPGPGVSCGGNNHIPDPGEGIQFKRVITYLIQIYIR